ncbi:MAG: hypothetical protein IPL47_14910 [Phyllobacteriaceae bacterium]|nr:hypothetical protein [Phyllobacteriaceae bacterium]
MSVALPLSRERYEAERKRLTEYLSELAGLEHDPTAHYAPFDDGGMGSFRIVDRSSGVETPEAVIDEYCFDDLDNVGVLVTVYSKGDGFISSVDFWKLDFSPIKAFPSNADLRKPEIVNRDI